MSPVPRTPPPDLSQREAGLTLIEVVGATALSLVVTLLAYQLLTATRQSQVATAALAAAEDDGNAAFDLMCAEIRSAGTSPIGARFDAIPSGDARRIRIVADRNGDGLLVGTNAIDEDLTYVFSAPDASGRSILERGVDRNGDGDFLDPGESGETILRNVVAVDGNGDGINDPYFGYDAAPPRTRIVRIGFGIRVPLADRRTRTETVPWFGSVLLRNQAWP